MTKRRKAKTKCHGGDKSPNHKFSVFEFKDDDSLIEHESRKPPSKFALKSPGKRRAYDNPVRKYDFLTCFRRGTMIRENDSGNGTSDNDVTNKLLEDRRQDVVVSPGSLIKSLSISVNIHDTECPFCGMEPCAHRSGKAGGCKIEKHKPVLYIESDEDGRMDLQTSTSLDLAEDKGLLEDGSCPHGTDAIDCEAVVVISPIYVKCGTMYYTNCSLTFSSSSIRLEGSPLYERKKPHRLEWSSSDIARIEHQPCESVKADFVNLHLRSEDTNVNETCNRNSGIFELEFVVIDETQWHKKQEELRSLNAKYEAAWETIISEFSFNEHFDGLVYPEGDPDAVFISKRDVELLQPMTFINDTIIDFYIKYLVNKTKPEDQRRFHFFNAFFFRKLADKDQISSSIWDGKEAFRRVRKWTRNIDLFRKEYIFIPVNSSLHWSLIIICHPGKVANLRDKDSAGSSSRPCILHMDSIRGSHKGLEKFIRSYLWEEWQVRYDKHDADISSKFSSLHFDALQLPQQENFSDCGLFLLHYAELFMGHAAHSSTAKYSDFLNEGWFLPAEVSLKKRDQIRRLISSLAKENPMKDPCLSCNDKYISDVVNEGNSSVEVVNRRDLNEASDGIKLNSGIDHQTKGQRSFIDMHEPETSCLSVDGSFQQSELHTSHPSRMRLSVEIGAIEKQSSFLPRGTRSRSRADEDDKFTPPHLLCNSFRVGEIEVPFNLQNEGYPVHEISSTPEKEKIKGGHCSVSSEDLADCIVEDSEEECGAQGIRSSRSILYIH